MSLFVFNYVASIIIIVIVLRCCIMLLKMLWLNDGRIWQVYQIVYQVIK